MAEYNKDLKEQYGITEEDWNKATKLVVSNGVKGKVIDEHEDGTLFMAFEDGGCLSVHKSEFDLYDINSQLKTFVALYVEETAHKVEVKAKTQEEAEKIAEAVYYGNEDELTQEELNQYVKTTTRPQDNTFCEIREVQ